MEEGAFLYSRVSSSYIFAILAYWRVLLRFFNVAKFGFEWLSGVGEEVVSAELANIFKLRIYCLLLQVLF
jgi:hypothetical protein